MPVRLAVAVASAAILFSRCGGDTPTSSASSASAETAQCTASLWSHVYDPGRLKVVGECRTVTGVITDHHQNEDGDIDVRLALDAPYADLVNGGNKASLNGHLQTEAICQAPIQADEAAPACRGFSGSVPIPPDGTHVRITGSYVLDTHHGWMEIHPISVLSVIP